MDKLKNYGNKTSKGKFIAICIKSVTAIIGGSMILQEGHPYLTLAILSVGAIANEALNFFYKDDVESNS